MVDRGSPVRTGGNEVDALTAAGAAAGDAPHGKPASANSAVHAQRFDSKGRAAGGESARRQPTMSGQLIGTYRQNHQTGGHRGTSVAVIGAR